jgi:hypothetical protein
VIRKRGLSLNIILVIDLYDVRFGRIHPQTG